MTRNIGVRTGVAREVAGTSPARFPVTVIFQYLNYQLNKNIYNDKLLIGRNTLYQIRELMDNE